MMVDEQFAELFAGRQDGYGRETGANIKQPLTPDHWMQHLCELDGSLGIYPMGDNGMVHWGCTDIDLGYERSWPLARNLQDVLTQLDITSWIERTKGKGYHLWVFLQTDLWVHASYMRNALLVAHQVAGVPPTEVNPKNPDPTKITWGNYVNLPYAYDWVGQDKRVMLDLEQQPIRLVEFLDDAAQWANTAEVIVDAASLYVEPPRREVVVAEYDGQLIDLTKKVGGLTFTVFRDGPLAGRDRSTTLMRLVYQMREDGLEPGEALVMLRDADARWGKFSDRPDCDVELMKIITRGYR